MCAWPASKRRPGAQIKEAIEKLGGVKLKGLVLDLRNNPGGVVTAALETASLFLKPGQSILTHPRPERRGENREGSGVGQAVYVSRWRF